MGMPLGVNGANQEPIVTLGVLREVLLTHSLSFPICRRPAEMKDRLCQAGRLCLMRDISTMEKVWPYLTHDPLL